MEINKITIDASRMSGKPKVTKWNLPNETDISIETQCGTVVVRIPGGTRNKGDIERENQTGLLTS